MCTLSQDTHLRPGLSRRLSQVFPPLRLRGAASQFGQGFLAGLPFSPISQSLMSPSVNSYQATSFGVLPSHAPLFQSLASSPRLVRKRNTIAPATPLQALHCKQHHSKCVCWGGLLCNPAEFNKEHKYKSSERQKYVMSSQS